VLFRSGFVPGTLVYLPSDVPPPPNYLLIGSFKQAVKLPNAQGNGNVATEKVLTINVYQLR
jgi:hypothetical protein